ncbi:MAG: methyltransferase [Mycobacteriaceae bacterium]
MLTPDLRAAFLRTGYDADTVLTLLGPDAHAALGRGEAVPARRAVTGSGELGTLVQLFLLGDDCSEVDVAAALAPVVLDDAVRAGLLERTPGGVRTNLDVRPLDFGAGTRWLVSDLDGDLRPHPTAADHVLGVGHASLSLLRAVPTAEVGTVLDLGTGCGVQAVHAAAHAQHVTGTDLSERALSLARVSCALNDLDVELLAGPWYAPVAGRRFDLLLANPPFVVGPPRVEHTYRDSGLDLDGASELVVRGAREHLTLGGTAALLASWVHVSGSDWRARVGSWLPAHGVDAWVVQRDVADPALYVGTWLRDAGVDPRSVDGAARTEAWLAHLAAADVTGVGFGYVFLRATDSASDVLCEDLTHGFEDPLGAEALDYLARAQWLRTHDLLDSRFVLAPGTALARVAVAGAQGGWEPTVVRVHRGGGPAWQHEIDELGAALLGGLTADGLPLGELVALLEVAHGEPADSLLASALELVHALVRHGVVRPA